MIGLRVPPFAKRWRVSGLLGPEHAELRRIADGEPAAALPGRHPGRAGSGRDESLRGRRDEEQLPHQLGMHAHGLPLEKCRREAPNPTGSAGPQGIIGAAYMLQVRIFATAI